MPQLIITENAMSGLQRCQYFLKKQNPLAMKKAAQAIRQSFERLENEPNIGRPFSHKSELRELIISFGRTGYVALYRFDKNMDSIYLLAFRHQKEAGY